MDDNSVIIDSDNKKLIIGHLYTIESYFTFYIKVKSGEFAGASNFCISYDDILSDIEELSTMYNKLTGCCKIHDCDSDAFITLEMAELGHIYISGQIGGSHEEHNMKFKYETDQTVLNRLIETFKSML